MKEKEEMEYYKEKIIRLIQNAKITQVKPKEAVEKIYRPFFILFLRKHKGNLL